MCSVSTFLGTLPGYLLDQDSQPSSTSHRQKLTMRNTQSCPVCRRDGFQHKPSGHLQWLPQKLPAEGTSMSTVQRSNLPKQGNPAFFSKPSRQLPAYDIPPSSTRHRRKLPGYGTQPSPARYPKLRGQATQFSSTRHHTCNGIVRKIQWRGNNKDFNIVRTRIRYGYSHQV